MWKLAGARDARGEAPPDAEGKCWERGEENPADGCGERGVSVVDADQAERAA